MIDNGFPTIYGLEDVGFRMENVVAIELLRRKHYFNPALDVYYWQDRTRREVDFVVAEGFGGEGAYTGVLRSRLQHEKTGT